MPFLFFTLVFFGGLGLGGIVRKGFVLWGGGGVEEKLLVRICIN